MRKLILKKLKSIDQRKPYIDSAIKKILKEKKKLDVDPQRDDDASPMSTYM